MHDHLPVDRTFAYQRSSSSSSNKRKETIETTVDQSKRSKTSSTREVFQTIARRVAALADIDEHRFEKDHADLQESCANELLEIMEKYKTKTIRNHKK